MSFGSQTMEGWHLIRRKPELLWARAMLPVPGLFSEKGFAFSVDTSQWAALLCWEPPGGG